jgi:hypothetical protein
VQLDGSWDFTFSKYRILCEALQEHDYHVTTFRDFLLDSDIGNRSKVVILRHDVDRRPLNASMMADLEHDLNIRSTYYFRSVRSSFSPEVMRKIEQQGHEVGYHYETLALANGDPVKAIDLFRTTLGEFRSICRVDTVCMHGSPLSRWNNGDIWKTCSLTDFGILGEPYFSLDYSKFIYLADTGRTWLPGKSNLRDRVDSVPTSIATTDELIDFLRNGDKSMLISAHPERWAFDMVSFILSVGYDRAANVAKRILAQYRRTSTSI